MTLREIREVLKYYCQRQESAAKAQIQNAAFAAYHCAVFVRAKNFPKSLISAFPSLYGRTETGGVSAENWRESKDAFARIAERHNRAVEGGGAG